MTNRTVLKPFLHIARLAGVSALALAFFAPRSALAQEWLKDRRYEEGAGIRTGDLELHPGIGGEVGYDSNYFLRTNKESNSSEIFRRVGAWWR